MRASRSSAGSESARCSASATPSTLYGLTRSASSIVSAAPAMRESTSTPGSATWHATNSFATRFIPSRSGVTSATAASR